MVVYIGDDKIKELVNLKSKEELIGEVIGLLQSPITNVMSSLIFRWFNHRRYRKNPFRKRIIQFKKQN
jgi:hypothetical protein